MKHLPPLKSLHVFWLAAQHRSFKTAAEKMFVTQAAVSQQIRQLEATLGCELFVRSVRQVSLSAAGERLFPFVDQAFTSLHAGVRQVSADNQPGVLRISSLHSFTSSWLIHYLPEFQASHPDITVQLMPSNELVDFQNADVDLAIRMGRGGYHNVEARKVLTDEVVLVASPTLLAGIDSTSPDEVFSLPVIFDTSPAFPELYQQCAASFGKSLDDGMSSIKSDNAVPLIQHALAGQGILLTNKCLVVQHLQNGTLEIVLNYRVSSPYSLFLVAPERHFTFAKVKAFTQWFAERVKQSFKG